MSIYIYVYISTLAPTVLKIVPRKITWNLRAPLYPCSCRCTQNSPPTLPSRHLLFSFSLSHQPLHHSLAHRPTSRSTWASIWFDSALINSALRSELDRIRFDEFLREFISLEPLWLDRRNVLQSEFGIKLPSTGSFDLSRLRKNITHRQNWNYFIMTICKISIKR